MSRQLGKKNKLRDYLKNISSNLDYSTKRFGFHHFHCRRFDDPPHLHCSNLWLQENNWADTSQFFLHFHRLHFLERCNLFFHYKEWNILTSLAVKKITILALPNYKILVIYFDYILCLEANIVLLISQLFIRNRRIFSAVIIFQPIKWFNDSSVILKIL